MDLQTFDAADAAARTKQVVQAYAAAPAAFEALQESAKGRLMYGLSGRPLSITATQVVFALQATTSAACTQEDYIQACDELLAEGAIDHYRLINHTSRCRTSDGRLDRLDTSLGVPVVLAVRQRSACPTGISPAAD